MAACICGRAIELKHTATHCSTLQHIATHCNTPHLKQLLVFAEEPTTETHCNTPPHSATLRNTPQHTALEVAARVGGGALQLQHTATHRNTP